MLSIVIVLLMIIFLIIHSFITYRHKSFEERKREDRNTVIIYKEDFTDASWSELCKELDIKESSNRVQLIVADIIIHD